MNAVDDHFANPSRRPLKQVVFKGVVDLQAATNHCPPDLNDKPKPFVWTAKPGAIRTAVKGGKETLEAIH